MRLRHRWLIAGGILAGFLAGLAACQDTLRRERVATCRRALPAVTSGASVRFQSAGPGPAPDTVRVDYAEGGRQHRLACRFDAGGTLTQVAVDGTALSAPALYMLRRYYLDTPDAAEADPGAR